MTKTKKMNFKQFRTRAIALILAILTIFPMFSWIPMQVSAASSSEETIPSYIEFQAQEYASNFSMESGLSYASNLYDQLKADSDMQAGIAAWEAAHIVASPSHVNKSGVLYKGDFYRIAIFDMLDASNQDSVMSFILENAYNDRESAVYELANTLADEFDTDVSKLDLISMKDFKKFIKDFDLENFIGDFENDFNNPTVSAVDAIDIVFDVFNNASDAVNAVASYRAIANMRNGVLQVLNAIADDESNDWALRNAAKDCVPIFNDSYNQILNEIATGIKVYAGTAFNTVASVVLDLGWSALVSMVPGANAFMFGLKGFRALMNATFDFDERNEIYYKIEAAVIIERAVRRIAENSRKAFAQSPNDEIASFYMESIYFYQKAIVQGVSYSIEYLENHIEAPGSQFLFWITGKYDDMENAIATAKSIKENRINTYAYIAQGVRAKYITLYCQDHNTVINKFINQIKDSSVTTVTRTNYAYDADKAIAYAKEHCSSESNIAKDKCNSGWLCAEFVANCLEAGGFDISGYVATVNAKAQGEYMQQYGAKIPGKVTGKAIKDDFILPLQKGDIVYVVYDNTVSASGHVLLYSGEKDANGNLLFYAHNNRKSKETYTLTGKYLSAASEIYAIHLDESGETTASTSTKYSLVWPVSTKTVKIGKVSSKFGPRTAPTKGASTLHRGIDIAVKSGTSVYSSADGTVTSVGYSDARGNYIVIYHENINVSTLYQHLKSSSVKKGDKVKSGQEIAKSGNTGVGTGAHLHYGVMIGKATKPGQDQPSYDMAIDPLSASISYVDYTKASNVEYKITSATCTGTTNDSATIKVALNTTASVKKWTYFLSTDESVVKNVDGTVGSTHKSTSNMSCVRILDYTSSPKSQKTDTFVINKYLGKPLAADTTYYYKATVYIGNKWYETDVCSFKTSKTMPGASEVRVSSDSSIIGIEDQATVLWNAVEGAEKYNITVKNSSGNTIHTKSNITGTTCVLDGMSSSGVYTVEIEAVNSAGVTKGKSATFTVMPDVTVTFYDTLENKVIDSKTAHWGKGVAAPQAPQHEGHTFSKWSATFDKVKEDIQINTVYNVNSYTVKFVDSITGAIIYQQNNVKYGTAATAPTSSQISVPDGHAFSAWDKDFSCIKADTTVYTVYKWVDKDNTATIGINSIKRSATEQGYEVNVTISNKISKISTGYAIFVLKSSGGAILSTFESLAFTIDSLSSQTLTATVLCDGLAEIAEVYVVNGYDALGQISKVAKQTIDNSTSSGWSDWIQYTGSCPMSSGNGVTVETKTESSTTATKYYYRYKILSTTTSYSTSMSGWTQNGYTLVNAGTSSITYVSNWHSGFLTSNALYSQYNNAPISAYENATQKVVVNSDEVVGYIYWHWCRGENKGAINRKINWTKTSEFDTFHAFFSTEKLDYCENPSGTKVSGANAYGCVNKNCCKDTYWWNGSVSGNDNVITVRKQTYTTYNKLYNYYQYSGYSNWIETSSSTAPISNGQSAGTNKTYQNVETKKVPGTTTYTYFYKYMTTENPVVTEPSISSDCIKTLNGNVGSQFAGKAATIWVYKSDEPSNQHIQYVGTTTVGTNGEINISNAKLLSTPTIETGDYTIIASVSGQAKAIKIGTIEAPKPVYTVKFFDFDGSVISEQSITYGDSAVLPSEELLNVPEGYVFTTWNQSVVNVRDNLEVTPEYKTKEYVVAFVDWNAQTVELKEFFHGADLYVNNPPKDKDGYITEWVINVNGEYLTIQEFKSAGYSVTSNMVVETRSSLEKHTVIIIGADENKLLDSEKLLNDGITSEKIASEYIVENGNYIDFEDVQMIIEENPDYIFVGWINAYTGEAIDATVVNQNIAIYPSYEFAETTEVPEASVITGEYESEQVVELVCYTNDATIWYTTDNSDPKISNTAVQYTSPITISKSCVLRFYASSLGKNDSCEESELYAINTGDSEKYHIVTIWSDILDESGADPAQGLIKKGMLLPESLFSEIEGYNFEGMFYDSDYTNVFEMGSQSITESVDLFAKYSYDTYVVEYRDYNGSSISVQIVEYTKSALEPMPPSRDGYVFVKWDRECDYITGNTVINAVYIPVSEYATIELETQNMHLQLGENKQISAILKGNGNLSYEIVWESANPDIARVDQNGNIVAISVGVTTVTALLPYTGSEAIIIVTVTEDITNGFAVKQNSSIGFDSKGYLRGVSTETNTVSQIRGMFDNTNLVFCDSSGKVLGESDLVTTGTVIKMFRGDELIAETIVIVTGDFNGDGKVNNKDIVMINQYIANNRIANEAQMLAIDVNGDGNVNSRDCIVISNYLVDKEVLK